MSDTDGARIVRRLAHQCALSTTGHIGDDSARIERTFIPVAEALDALAEVDAHGLSVEQMNRVSDALAALRKAAGE